MKGESIVQALEWRYATKEFDSGAILDEVTVNQIIESARLTATSYGLQLMKLVDVRDKAIRKKLVDYSFGQHQVKDASHLLVLCREKEVDYDLIDHYISDISKTRKVPTESLEGFKNMMGNTILTKSQDEQILWMEKQVYIALGNILTVCAMLKVDSCPMEGFIPEKYDEALGLEALGLTSILVIPIGVRAENDKYSRTKKVRRDTDRFLVKI